MMKAKGEVMIHGLQVALSAAWESFTDWKGGSFSESG